MVRGNTSERLQAVVAICRRAERIAGWAFADQTGTLVERLQKAVEICRKRSRMSSEAIDELERLLNAAKVAELLRKPGARIVPCKCNRCQGVE